MESQKKGEGKMGDRDKTTIYAHITRGRKRKLFHRLLDDGLFFYEWLNARVDEYVNPPKKQRTARKEA